MPVKLISLLTAKKHMLNDYHHIVIISETGERLAWNLDLDEIEDMEAALLDTQIQLRAYRMEHQKNEQ